MTESEIEDLLAFGLDARHLSPKDTWWKLANGELTPEQAIAVRQGVESDEELRRRAELFAPPSERERAAILAAITTDTAPSAREPRPRARTAAVALGSALAMAASLLLVLHPSPPPEEPVLQAELMPLYEILPAEAPPALTRSVQPPSSPRSSTSKCTAEYDLAGEITLYLRPSTPSQADLSIAALATHEDGTAHWLPPLTPQPPTPQGVITIRERVKTLGLRPGTWTLTVFIARSGHIPAPAALLERAVGQYTDVVVQQVQICILG